MRKIIDFEPKICMPDHQTVKYNCIKNIKTVNYVIRPLSIDFPILLIDVNNVNYVNSKKVCIVTQLTCPPPLLYYMYVYVYLYLYSVVQLVYFSIVTHLTHLHYNNRKMSHTLSRWYISHELLNVWNQNHELYQCDEMAYRSGTDRNK